MTALKGHGCQELTGSPNHPSHILGLHDKYVKYETKAKLESGIDDRRITLEVAINTQHAYLFK